MRSQILTFVLLLSLSTSNSLVSAQSQASSTQKKRLMISYGVATGYLNTYSSFRGNPKGFFVGGSVKLASGHFPRFFLTNDLNYEHVTATTKSTYPGYDYNYSLVFRTDHTTNYDLQELTNQLAIGYRVFSKNDFSLTTQFGAVFHFWKTNNSTWQSISTAYNYYKVQSGTWGMDANQTFNVSPSVNLNIGYKNFFLRCQVAKSNFGDTEFDNGGRAVRFSLAYYFTRKPK